MLTFDDGPDPKYTPLLLDILKANNVKATFFILAEKALEHTDIVERILEEGHQIGLHYLNHSNPLLRSPIKTKKEFKKAHGILTDMGIVVKLFRPPWGLFNPWTYHYAKANNLKVILWSQQARDWSRWTTTEKIKNSLIKNTKKGAIILLHDGRGAKGAPGKTIKALSEALPVLKKKGFNFVQAENLLGGIACENATGLFYKDNRRISS